MPTYGPPNRLVLRLTPPAALYRDWLIAETEASFALHAWRDAASNAKARAFAAYQSALDGEAYAAHRLAARLDPA